MSNDSLPKGFVRCSCGNDCVRKDNHGPATGHRHDHGKFGPIFFVWVTGNEDKKNLPEHPNGIVCVTCMSRIVKDDSNAKFVSMSEYDRTRLSAKFADLLVEKNDLLEQIRLMKQRFQFLTGHRQKPRREARPKITNVTPAPHAKQATA